MSDLDKALILWAIYFGITIVGYVMVVKLKKQTKGSL